MKRLRPCFSSFIELMAATGLRFGEAVNSYNLIHLLNSEGKLGDYYVHDKSTLEHYKYKEVFLRNTKKVFVSFAPEDLVSRILKAETVNKYTVQTSVKRCLPLRFSDVREAHATFMTKFLKREEIDFLHGRCTSDVFMQHYFNPALISDLKERVFEGVREIQNMIKVS